jgi:protoporphyrinogen IX oxidase
MDSLLLRALHLYGAILWFGGTATVAMAAIALDPASQKPGALALRSAMRRIATPGMLLAFAGGLAILIPNFTAVYARAGWMHAKLLLVIVAAGLTGVISGFLRRTEAGQKDLPVGALRTLGLVVLVIGLVVVVLARLQPF